jgi:hypothetical protein
MATTTNYGFEIPDDTDLVKDGALAMRDLGQDVDTQLFTALGGDYPGLRLIKKQTIGSAVSSVNVTSAFSATYQNYKILISGGAGSTNAAISLKMGSAATGHDSVLIYGGYGGGGPFNDAASNTATWPFVGFMETSGITMDADLIAPNLSSVTRITAGFSNTLNGGSTNGRHNSTTAFTDFTIATLSGTMTGGTIYVYGYGAS